MADLLLAYWHRLLSPGDLGELYRITAAGALVLLALVVICAVESRR